MSLFDKFLFADRGSQQETEHSQSTTFRYDTDSANNAYIVGGLNEKQMTILDEILLFEKKNCGGEIEKSQLNALSKGDSDIIAAYRRWCWCKKLMRSSEHVIYPDERN